MSIEYFDSFKEARKFLFNDKMNALIWRDAPIRKDDVNATSDAPATAPPALETRTSRQNKRDQIKH